MEQRDSNNKFSDKYVHYLILSGIIILTLIIYSGSFKNDFTNLDDNVNITNNKVIQNLSTSGIVKMFSSRCLNTYEPLNIILRSLIFNFFGLNPTAFYFLNILLHLLNIILVYLFIYKLTSLRSIDHSPQSYKYRIQLASLVSLLFAIHPMNTEPICWLGGLDNELYSFFYLASVIFYLQYVQNKTQDTNIEAQENKNSTFSINANYVFSILLFILSLLSKPLAVTLPIILILLDYYNSSKFKVQSLKYWLDKIPFMMLAMVFGIINLILEGYSAITMINYTFLNRFFSLTYSISFYIVNFIAPFKLSGLYPPPEIVNGFLPIKYYLSPLFIIVLFLLIRKIFKLSFNTDNVKKYISIKTMIFGILFFLLTISFTLFAGKIRYYQLADRYTYIPYLGLYFIIGHFMIYNLQFTIYNLKFIVIILIILIFSVLSYNRSKVWANNISLFNDMVQKYPKSYLVYEYRGNAKKDLGDIYGAIEDYNKIIELNPKFADAFYNRGYAKAKLGDMKGAIKDFNMAIEINPHDAKAFNNRGNSKGSLGDIQGAINDFNRAIEINPKNAESYINRGRAKYYLRDKNGACSDWKKAGELGFQQAYEMINKFCH
jgi:protein O-mannosyl-transferase